MGANGVPAVDQHLDQLAAAVEDFDAGWARLRQPVFDQGRGVEGIGVVLPQDKALGHGLGRTGHGGGQRRVVEGLVDHMPVGLVLAAVVVPQVIGHQRRAREGLQGAALGQTVLPGVNRDGARIDGIGQAARPGGVEEAEIARLVAGQPVADDIDFDRVAPEDDDIAHEVFGLAGVGAVHPVAVAAVDALDHG